MQVSQPASPHSLLKLVLFCRGSTKTSHQGQQYLICLLLNDMSSSSAVVSSSVVYGSALTTIYTAAPSCFDLPSTFETSLCWSNAGVQTCTWSQPESCYPPGPGILSSTTTRGIPVHLTYGYSPGVLPYGFNTFEGANWGPGQTNEVWGCYVWVGAFRHTWSPADQKAEDG